MTEGLAYLSTFITMYKWAEFTIFCGNFQISRRDQLRENSQSRKDSGDAFCLPFWGNEHYLRKPLTILPETQPLVKKEIRSCRALFITCVDLWSLIFLKEHRLPLDGAVRRVRVGVPDLSLLRDQGWGSKIIYQLSNWFAFVKLSDCNGSGVLADVQS